MILDNLVTRLNVSKLGGSSITPISDIEERIKLLRQKSKAKIEFINGTVLDNDLVRKLIATKFSHIFHLGHLRTAPFSMSSHKNCVDTVQNNEIGFLNLIWALKELSRSTVLVKLGSFGAYAPAGIKIPESDIIIKTDTESVPVPFPKMAQDFYHITKANDSLFARAACLNWGLKIVDVMQSTVFGTATTDTLEIGEHTRCDYDETYGTVVNRFVIQGVVGMPLTVYGGGNHSTGIMVLDDAISSIAQLRKVTLEYGEYKVVNNNPKSYKIIELAEMVKNELFKNGIKAEISFDYDPRHEAKDDADLRITTAECKFINDNIKETNIIEEISRSIQLLSKYKCDVKTSVINPTLDWAN